MPIFGNETLWLVRVVRTSFSNKYAGLTDALWIMSIAFAPHFRSKDVKVYNFIKFYNVFSCVNNFNFSGTQPLLLGTVVTWRYLQSILSFKTVMKRKNLISKNIELLLCLLTFCSQYLHLKRLNLDQLLNILFYFCLAKKSWYGLFRFLN